MDITLTSTEFKALSSETRTEIIKLLKERNHTLTELAEKMGLSSPTVKEHLEKLEHAQLIESIDSGHKWKYYCLTRKGKTIFGESKAYPSPNILIIVGIATIALVALLFSFMAEIESFGKQSIIASDRFYGTEQAKISSGQKELENRALTETAASGIQNNANTVAIESANQATPSIQPVQEKQIDLMQIGLYLIAMILLSLGMGYYLGKKSKN